MLFLALETHINLSSCSFQHQRGYLISFYTKQASSKLVISPTLYQILDDMFCFIQIMFFFYDNPHYSVVSNKKYYNHQVLLYIPCNWKKQKTSCFKYPCFENLGLSTALKFNFHFSWGNTEKINNQRHCKGRHFHFDRLWQIFRHLRKSTQSRNICHSLSKSNCHPLQCLWILIF